MLNSNFIAQERNVQFETKFNKTQKTIKKFELFIYFGFTLFLFFGFYQYPLIVASLSFILALLLKLNSATVFELKKEIEKIGVFFEQEKKYFVKIGDAVTSIEEVPNAATVRNPKKSRLQGFNPEAIRYPIIVEATQMLTHMFVIGTTGAGKTTFLTNILEQVLTLGGGCMVVDGKGDQSVYEAFYNTAIDCGREDDFFVINYNLPEESNTLSLLSKGTADEITDIIGNMLEQGGDNSFWSGRALSMMKGLLSILVVLKDNGLLFNPDGEKEEILTFTLLQKWIADVNIKKLYYTIRVANKILNNTFNFYKEDTGDVFEENPLEYMHGTNSSGEITVSGSDSEEAYEYYEKNKDKLKLPFGKKEFDIFRSLTYEKNEQIYKGIDIDRLESYLTSVYFPIDDEFDEITESSSKQHGNSFLMWNEALDLIGGRYGKIFDTKFPEIDMQDIVSNGRILYILLPSIKVDPRTLSVLGKIILGFFKQSVSVLLGDKISGTIEERYRSFAIRPRIPFWAVMDEYGAYAVKGFDNVLAQARSLKVSVAILVQEIASLEKGDKIESLRLLGNTGLKIILKLEDQSSIDDVIKFIGEEEVAFVGTGRVNEELNDRSIHVEKRTILTNKKLRSMTAGHSYIMWAGKVVPALVRYYEPPIAKVIPKFTKFKKNVTQKYYRNKFIEDYLDIYKKNYSEYFSNNKSSSLKIKNNYWGDYEQIISNNKKVT